MKRKSEPAPIMQATSVIVHHIAPQYIQNYRDWAIKARNLHQEFEGYLATDIISPVGAERHFIVLIRFTDREHALIWLHSEQRKQLLEEAKPWLERDDHYAVQDDADFWFSPEQNRKKPRPWKQWIISSLIVFPLTSTIPPAYSLIFEHAGLRLSNFELKLISALTVSALITFLIMPFVTNLLAKWLLK